MLGCSSASSGGSADDEPLQHRPTETSAKAPRRRRAPRGRHQKRTDPHPHRPRRQGVERTVRRSGLKAAILPPEKNPDQPVHRRQRQNDQVQAVLPSWMNSSTPRSSQVNLLVQPWENDSGSAPEPASTPRWASLRACRAGGIALSTFNGSATSRRSGDRTGVRHLPAHPRTPAARNKPEPKPEPSRPSPRSSPAKPDIAVRERSQAT